MLRAFLVTFVGAFTACVPQTNLFPAGNSGPGDAGAGAAVLLVEPTPGAVAPQNLAAVVLRMPATLRVEGAAAQLRPAGGAPVPLGPASAVDCTGEGRCYVFTVAGRVPPGRYDVTGPAGAHLDDGRPVPAATAGAFSVTAELDSTPPVVDPPLLETVGDCLRVRFGTGEPARASLLVRAAATSASSTRTAAC